jgi:predicted dithiol-disulfide oxidoreductase (DUF899 family)
MQPQKIVSEKEWLAARKALLAKEKEFTHARDALSAERRALPWAKVEKNYVFDTPQGKKTLADLFGKNSQLIVYHFMWRWDIDSGCPSCSFLADHFDGANLHLAHRDVSLVVITRAPVAKFAPYVKRLGWRFSWASSYENDFNFDYHVSFTEDDVAKRNIHYNYDLIEEPSYRNDELPGVSVFYKDDKGDIFHTYSSYARGLDILVGAYNFLDLTPKGRDEDELPWTMAWVRRHDEYEDSGKSQSCCGSEGRKDDAA